MAFTAPDPNQETPGPTVPAAQQAPVAAGGAGIAGSSKAAATPGQNVPAQPSAQLSAYLAANQPQSAALGQNVASTVGGQVNAAGNAINSAVNTYTGNLYTVPTDADVNSAVSTAPSSLTADQATTFKNELGASAAAPNPASTFESGQGYADATAGVQKAVEQANLWNSANDVASISSALAPFEGANATAGDKTLDSLLLAQTPGAYNQIKSAVAPAAGLSGNLSTGAAAADAALQNAVAQDQAATTAAQGSANGYFRDLNSYLNSTVASDQAAQNAVTLSPGAQSQLYQSLGAGGGISDTSAATLAALGITPEQAAALNSEVIQAQQPQAWYGPNNAPEYTTPVGQTLSLNQYLTQNGAVVPNINNVASNQNFSDVAALEAILSAAGYTSPVSDPLSGLDPSQAGTFHVTPNDQFNYSGALNAVNQYNADQNAAMFANGYTRTPNPNIVAPPYTPPPAPVIINGPSDVTPPGTLPAPTPNGPYTIPIDPTTGAPVSLGTVNGSGITSSPSAPGTSAPVTGGAPAPTPAPAPVVASPAPTPVVTAPNPGLNAYLNGTLIASPQNPVLTSVNGSGLKNNLGGI